MSERETLSNILIEQEKQQFREVNAVTFDEIKRGSKLLVHTGTIPKEIDEPDYEIDIIGKRKDGLRVTVKDAHPLSPDRDQFTARLTGGIHDAVRIEGPERQYILTAGTIMVSTPSEKNCIYFESLKYHKIDARARGLMSDAITKILFKP